MPDDEDKEPGLLRRFWLPLTALALTAIGLGAWHFLPKDNKPKKKQSVSMVNIMPPPPPPPPPVPTPPPTPPPEEEPQPQEQPEQEFVEETAEAPAEDSPPEDSIGSNITGDGPPDGFGLVGKGGTGLPGGRGFGGGGGGTKWAA
ncbi:MAG: hypothetical protein N2322_05005, partial [Terrimicrobiaceae bacterium]|nr:hypothetical protein [Terrimicrobiaceae bacterium]